MIYHWRFNSWMTRYSEVIFPGSSPEIRALEADCYRTLSAANAEYAAQTVTMIRSQ